MSNSIIEKKINEALNKKITKKAFGDLIGRNKKGRPKTSEKEQFGYKCPKTIHDDFEILCYLNATKVASEIVKFIRTSLAYKDRLEIIENINATGQLDEYIKRSYGGKGKKIIKDVTTKMYTYRINREEYNNFMTLCQLQRTNVGTEIRLMMEREVEKNKDRIDNYKKVKKGE